MSMDEYVKKNLTFLFCDLLFLKPTHVQDGSLLVQISAKFKKEAPIYFSNIFISFLGLAYFTPLGCPVKFKIFLAV